MHEQDFVLNNLQRLISHKIYLNKNVILMTFPKLSKHSNTNEKKIRDHQGDYVEK